MGATNGGRMRRILAAPGAIAAILALAACGPGSLDPEPPAAPGAPQPSASPSASPSVSPEPTPEGERFDDVDLAAALVERPIEPASPESWGPWATERRDAIVPGLDPAAFASAPECAAAVQAVLDVAPEEVVRGGHPYEGVLVSTIIVGRMASSSDATAYVDALVAATTACGDAQGTAVGGDGVIAMRGPFEPSAAVADAGMQQALIGFEGSNHYGTYTLVAHDELVVVTPYSADVGTDVTAEAVAIVQTQIAALDAAVGD